MESATAGRVFMISAILALTAAASGVTHTPVTDSLRTSKVSQNESSAPETIAPAQRENPELPLALKIKHSCHESGQSYCMNGICKYHEDQDQVTKHRICVCKPGYTGERCQHMTLTSHTTEEPARYLYMAVGIGIGLLLSALAVVLFYCIQKRRQRSKTTYSKCSVVARV
ncbi:epigen-like [Heptranchias perlo]|uniref:epigen-like n=1 Tax=Heptranchias perlo TaxID=212740 RepID=UPI00355A8BB2